MGRVLAIDYGLKRSGLAVTDPLKIIGSPLETVQTENLISWLNEYIKKEEVEHIVIGLPVNLDMTDTHTTKPVKKIIERIKQQFPKIPVSSEDERFTSKIAQQTMIAGGMKKKERRKRSNVDKISAAIILQSFLARTNI
jgi:putative Holliday junction resolvase